MENEERAEVRMDQVAEGQVILAVRGKTHEPCWRQVAAVYRRDTPMAEGSSEMTKERWQVWFDDAAHPMGLIVYGDDRKFKLGTVEDLGKEVSR